MAAYEELSPSGLQSHQRVNHSICTVACRSAPADGGHTDGSGKKQGVLISAPAEQNSKAFRVERFALARDATPHGPVGGSCNDVGRGGITGRWMDEV